MAANINEKIVSFYDNARKTGKKFGTFSGYEEHNYVHVTRVADASTKLTKVLNEMIENGILGKEYAKISENTIYIAGLAHDLGMTEGGYVTFKDGTMMLIKDAVESTKDPNFKYTGEVKKMMKTSKDFSTLSLAEIEAQLIRGQHPLNSAITVLKNKDIFGEDSELIACLTLIHSKSTSGVKHIVDIKELSKMVETLYEHQEAGAYKFNVSKLVKCDANGIPLTEDGHYIFNDGVAEQFRTGAVALRVGDAHALKTGYNHGGGKIVITSRGELKSDDYLTSKLLTELAEEEAINSQIQIEYDNQNIIVFDNNDSDQLFSKRIILGESNVRNFDSYCDDKVLIHPYEVLSTDNPANTWLHGIQEKFGEYKTFGEIGQKVIVELPSDLTDDLFNVYKRFANDYAIDNEWLEIELRFGDNVYNTKSQITITS